MTNPNTGRFSWHELMTPDAAAAARFYSELFGWTVQEVDMGPMGVYRVFNHDGKGVGGCMLAAPGQPTAWLTYVASDDVEASVVKIREHGGKVIVPPTVVPGMVHFAIAMDPQGAAVGVLKGLGPDADAAPSEGPPAPGTFCWDELYTSDVAAAGKFYGDVFGWTGKVGEDAMKYWHWLNQGKDIGGMLPLQGPPGVPPHWMPYVAVAEVDASLAKAQALGAKLLMPVMDMPKVGKFAFIADPTGATLALFRSARV